MSSDDILDKIADIWRQWGISYRDTLLEAGRLLHDFIIAYLREGDEMGCEERLAKKRTRKTATIICAKRLQTNQQRISMLVSAAMTVELLSDGGDVGDMPHDSIRRFSRLVRRKSKGHDNGGPRAGQELSCTLFEEWEIKEEFKDTAKEYFQSAVRENWSIKQVNDFMLSLNDGEAKDNAAEYRREKRRRTETQEDAFKVLARLACAASPKDAAELLFDLIRETESPQAIVSHLQQLAKDSPKRARMCG